MTLASVILAFVTLQRLSELLISRRNTARLMVRGGREIGARHYPLLVSIHATWLIALWIWGRDSHVDFVLLGLFIVLQVFRFWVLATLGERWTTRIVVLPDAPLVKSGPYRFCAHPNYAVVIAEIALLPLVLGLPALALGFTILNGMALAIRIPVEARALSERSASPR